MDLDVLPSREDRAWAAGFFDGEGSTAIGRTLKRRNTCPAMSLTQAEPSVDAVHHFHKIVGVGRVYGPERASGLGTKLQYRWKIAGFESVQYVVAMLWPWLHVDKRSQAMHALKECALTWQPRVLQPCGTYAAWSRGCRCSPCVEACNQYKSRWARSHYVPVAS